MKSRPYLIVGLGNPGEEYHNTPHNAGFMVAEAFRTAHDFIPWAEDRQKKSLVTTGQVAGHQVTLIWPQTFMNKSGEALRGLVKSQKDAERLCVIHDDLDLPLGRFKLSFNRGAGGHHGVESVIKTLKTEAFLRVRVGICPTTPAGKLKKPPTNKQVVARILGRFKPAEQTALKPVIKKIILALQTVIVAGREKAMNLYN